MKRQPKIKKSTLEKDYNSLFLFNTSTNFPRYDTLAQPSPLKIVQSAATSGAYEEPIKQNKVIKQHA